MAKPHGKKNKYIKESNETERRFRAIFDGAFEFIGLLTPDGTVIEANQMALNYVGLSATEVIGRPFWETAWWKDSAEQQQRLKAAIAEAATGKFVRFEAQHTGRDGTVDIIDFSLRPAVDDAGRVTYLIPEGRRITERKQAEKDSAILAAIVSSANDAIISSRDFVIQTWNNGAERLFGWSAAEAIGQHVKMLMPPTHLQEMRNIFAQLDRGESVPHFDTVRQRKDGSLVDVSLTIAPVKQGEQLITNSAIIHDITGRKQAQAALSASEERLQIALAVGRMGTWDRDLRTRKSHWDNGMYEICGFEPGEAIDVAAFEAQVHPEDLPVVRRAVDHTVETGAEYRCEFRFLRPDGRMIWLHARGGVRRNPDGTPTHLVGINFDITEKKQAEQKLRESEERFRLLSENIDRVFWFVELEPERITYVSPASEQLWGVPADRLYENPRLRIEMTHPEDRSNFQQAFEDWVTGRAQSYDVEYRVVRQNGELRWMHDRGIVIGFKHGLPYKFSGITKDITERKQVEEERRAADRRKDEFIAILAHELRNPLAPIRNVVNLLQKQGSLDPNVRRARDVIGRQIDHLTRLIDDLLDVSRITSDKLELRKERVALTEVVNLAVESSHPLIDQHQHKLSLLLPGKPIYLKADKLRLAQVLMNLLTNAAKYTPEGGRITLSAEQDGEKIVLRVTDNGVGIASDQLPQIFDMFYQANRSYEQLHGGLGIGLTLTRRLVEMHGGQVEAHSTGLNQGSEFVVRLPILQGQLQPQGETFGPEMMRATGKRILVVDDYGENAETLAELLRVDGNDVEIAHDGLKAVEVAEEFRPAVVLLDIGMPKLNGYEAARQIRQQPWGKNMVLIAVTGWGGENDRNRSREAGFNAHLLKPVNYSELAKLINYHLR